MSLSVTALGREGPVAHGSAVKYVSAKPLREASLRASTGGFCGEPWDWASSTGSAEQAKPGAPVAAGRGVGAGEAQKCSSPPATFDGAGPLPAYCHPWDPGTMVAAAPEAPGLAWMSQGFCTSFLIMLALLLFLKKQVLKSLC